MDNSPPKCVRVKRFRKINKLQHTCLLIEYNPSDITFMFPHSLPSVHSILTLNIYGNSIILNTMTFKKIR